MDEEPVGRSTDEATKALDHGFRFLLTAGYLVGLKDEAVSWEDPILSRLGAKAATRRKKLLADRGLMYRYLHSDPLLFHPLVLNQVNDQLSILCKALEPVETELLALASTCFITVSGEGDRKFRDYREVDAGRPLQHYNLYEDPGNPILILFVYMLGRAS